MDPSSISIVSEQTCRRVKEHIITSAAQPVRGTWYVVLRCRIIIQSRHAIGRIVAADWLITALYLFITSTDWSMARFKEYTSFLSQDIRRKKGVKAPLMYHFTLWQIGTMLTLDNVADKMGLLWGDTAGVYKQ